VGLLQNGVQSLGHDAGDRVDDIASTFLPSWVADIYATEAATGVQFAGGIPLGILGLPLLPEELATSGGRIDAAIEDIKAGIGDENEYQALRGIAGLGGEASLWAGTASMVVGPLRPRARWIEISESMDSVALHGNTAALDQMAMKLAIEGHQVSNGRATVTAQAVRDVQGNRLVMGVVTGNDGAVAGLVVRADDIIEHLGSVAGESGIKTIFERGGHYPDLHSEGIHEMIFRQDNFSPLGPTYTNRLGCSAQCLASQRAIDAIVLEVTISP
jgi:hypothetical protein